MFTALVADWRAYAFDVTLGLSNPLFPFGITGLSTWNQFPDDHCPRNMPLHSLPERCTTPIVRWAQTRNIGHVPNALLPNTFMAITTDLGDYLAPVQLPVSSHSRCKKEVSARLVLGALNIAYGYRDVYWSGPIAVHASCSNQLIKVTFREVGKRGLVIKHQDYLHFEVEVANTWLPMTIDSHGYHTVTLTCKTTQDVSQSSRIRYDWDMNPCDKKAGILHCAVYAQEEQLPAPPFIMNIVHI